MLPAYFDPVRSRLSAAITHFLREKKTELSLVNALGADAIRRLEEFCIRGKMIRGCLVHLGWALAGGTGADGEAAAIQTGAAMELFQSGLLVHDDIMDRDPVRRGQPSIFQQYATAAGEEGRADPIHLGQALGICAGDVAYFMAFELLARSPDGNPALCEVLGLCARELSAVGIAQMQDVTWGAAGSAVSAAEVLHMYRWKTGRYSFSLPLDCGALIAGASPALRSRLEACGEELGLLFQIRDDELGLFGAEEEIGKPVGSDIREGKKTILVAVLLETVGDGDRQRLAGILGNPRCSEEDLQFVRQVAASRAAQQRIRAITSRLKEKVLASIEGLGTGTGEELAALRGLLDYAVERRQ